jgi:hypothetical protein
LFRVYFSVSFEIVNTCLYSFYEWRADLVSFAAERLGQCVASTG